MLLGSTCAKAARKTLKLTPDIPIAAQSDNALGVVDAFDGNVVGLDVTDKGTYILATGISWHGEVVCNLRFNFIRVRIFILLA
jgi:hypothetical protein